MKKTIAILLIKTLFTTYCFGQYSLYGNVIDEETKKSIPNIKLRLIGIDGSIHNTSSDISGNYSFTNAGLKSINYILTVNDSMYDEKIKSCFVGKHYTYRVDFTKSKHIDIDVILSKPSKEIFLPDFYFKPNSIMFSDQVSKSNIDSLHKVLIENVKITIELEGKISNLAKRSDSIGFNRAKIIKAALVKKGIDPRRIQTTETILKDGAEDKNDVICSILSNDYDNTFSNPNKKDTSSVLALMVQSKLKIDSGDFSNVLITILKGKDKEIVLSSKNNFSKGNIKAYIKPDTINGRASNQLIFNYNLRYQNSYLLVFEKKKYITKTVAFNTTVPIEILNDGFDPYVFNVTLHKQPKGKKLKYDSPVGAIKYYVEKDDFDFDSEHKAELIEVKNIGK